MRFRNSIELVKTSWSVLRADKELLWLPVLSMLATLVVGASFAVGVLFTAAGTGSTGQTTYTMSVVSWVLTFLAYVVLAYITIFFNAALIAGAQERLDGGNPSLGSALSAAGSRAGTILPWAIVSATVSMAIRIVQERFGAAGAILGAIGGVAWALVTFLVLPILVIERIGVVDAIKRSASLFRKTWGENVIGQGGIGLIGFLAALVIVPVVVLLVITQSTPLVVTGIAVGIVWMLGVAVVMTALNAVYQTALYRYAATGQVPDAFAPELITGAFAPRKSPH